MYLTYLCTQADIPNAASPPSLGVVPYLYGKKLIYALAGRKFLLLSDSSGICHIVGYNIEPFLLIIHSGPAGI